MSEEQTLANTDENWLERIWEHREAVLYRGLFGVGGEKIFVLSAEMFLETFQQESYDPRWLFNGVLEYAPTATRASWLYVTSGMSNAWEDDLPDPEGISGIGCEFVFETTAQSQWAITRLQELMAYQILLSCGQYEGRELIGYFDRIPLRRSIDPAGNSEIQNLMVCPPETYPQTIQLDSGAFDFFALVGITNAEAQFAREQGSEQLLHQLKAKNAFPITDPARTSVV